MILGIDILSIQCVSRVCILLHGPLVESINFVEGDAEGRVLLLEELD